jgi:hypothetical protein
MLYPSRASLEVEVTDHRLREVCTSGSTSRDGKRSKGAK